MHNIKIGIIGGSGLYQMEALENRKEISVTTPFGNPSCNIITGTISGVDVAFIARHGQKHHLLPTEVPYAANIYALKQLGVRYLLSVSAVGSLQEHIAPLDMVLPDQYIDLTKLRQNTFFGNEVIAHVSMAQPTCKNLTQVIQAAAQKLNQNNAFNIHMGGTYVCIEGPQFSTLAESNWYRSMNASIIGMTNMPEAKLAREAQIAYASLAMVTDFDCWHPREANVTASLAIANLMKNAERAQLIICSAVEQIAHLEPQSEAHRSLAEGLVTPESTMSAEAKARLDVLLRSNS